MRLRPMHDRVVVRKDSRQSFSLPDELVDDPSFSIVEKCEILAEWASDRSAVESYPSLRWLPGTSFPVTFSSVMDARRKLDKVVEAESRKGRVKLSEPPRSAVLIFAPASLRNVNRATFAQTATQQ
jgi:hypothetical protein